MYDNLRDLLLIRLRIPLAITALLMLCVPGTGQLYNITTILSQELPAEELLDPQLHRIDNQGLIVGSLASPFNPENRRLFVLRKAKNRQFLLQMIGEYVDCEIHAVDEQGQLLINARLPGRTKVEPLILNLSTKEVTTILPLTGNLANGVMLANDQVAVNTRFDHLPDRSQYLENPFREQRSSLREVPKRATKATIRDLATGKEIPIGFPAALWYNLNTAVSDFNANGHACGQSEGYSIQENMTSPYPFLATKDSVYRLLDGYQGMALSMNDLDQVVGYWTHPLTGRKSGFFHDKGLLSSQDYDWIDLQMAWPSHINNQGLVAGQKGDTAFFWLDQKLLSTHQMVPNLPADWKVEKIIDLNDENEVIAVALKDDEPLLFWAVLETTR
ncbi:MAG: hypothetical protein AAGA85_20105 [Bacteroidota bacterium]